MTIAPPLVPQPPATIDEVRPLRQLRELTLWVGAGRRARTPLPRVIAKPGDRVRYTYDFGDDWEHEILVEKLLSADPGGRYPVCVGGRGACPPEDCGGRWGYARLRATLADPRHEEHDEMLDWLGLDRAEEFDATAFDVDEVNAVL